MSLKSWYRIPLRKSVAQNTLEIINLLNTTTAHQLIWKSCSSASRKRIFPEGGGQLSTWTKQGGIWNRHMGLPALWVVIWDSLISTYIAQCMGCVIGSIRMALRSYSVLDICCLPLSSLCKTTHRHWKHINVCRVSCGGVFNMLLSYRLPFIFITIYGVICVQMAHFSSRWLKGYIYSSCYYHHQIGSIHLSHCYHIFRGCVPEMFVTS